MEVLKAMTAREVLNLIEWLKSKNFTNDDIVDCIESVEGKKKIKNESGTCHRSFLFLSRDRKKPHRYKLFSIYAGFPFVEIVGFEPVTNPLFYGLYSHSCCISCDTFSKCFRIFLFCLAVSISITFRYTLFITLSLAQPPLWRIYWSGTPIACMIDAA